MEEPVNELLPLAAKIAREFSNIPGLPHAEIDLAAQEALANAARHFDPAKGDFTAYAARAMRNALRDLYERQIRHHRHHIYDLDLPITESATTPEARVQQVEAPDFPLANHAAAALESGKRLEMAMESLSPRLNRNQSRRVASRPPLPLHFSVSDFQHFSFYPMSTVHLQVHSSDGTSKSFALTEHDTFLLGRMADCHLCVPGDPQVSRHHFLLEACPPLASLRDLGSINGTHVNGKKCGGREKGETPEQGALRQYPSTELNDGDRIIVGQSTIKVRVETAPDAALVPAALPEGDLSGLSPEAMRRLIFGSPEKELFTLPGYRIQRELGRGGCGAVYLATRESGGDPVAVKLMLSRAKADTRAVDQFKREMKVIAGLQHPNIVRFLDSGSDEGTFFFVMEYCDGGSLADVAKARGGTIPPNALMPWAIQALEGLAAAHKQGFVHRDIKPQNILLHRNRAKISDFGLAKNFQKAGLSGMSITGQYASTPVFMPPEQITNFKYVKPVSDVWSFAASLYQLLTGKFPYRFDPKRDPIDIILNEPPVPILDRMPGLDKNLAAVIDKALVRSPQDRFPDAGKLLASLPKPRP